jgi:hypothetical protein
MARRKPGGERANSFRQQEAVAVHPARRDAKLEKARRGQIEIISKGKVD